MLVLGLIGAAVLGAVALSGFLRLEATGRRHITLAIIVALVLVESMLNRSEYDVPVGLFRFSFGGYDVRPPDLAIALALGARFLAGGTIRRVTPTGLAWAGFLLWYFGSAVTGVLFGNDLNEVFFQGKAIYYLTGMAIVASGTSFDPLVRARALGRWAAGLGVAALFTIVTGVLFLHWAIMAGPLKLPDLGLVNNDAISLLIAGGGVLLLVEATRTSRRAWVGAAGVLCFLTPFSGSQRANYLALAGSAVILVLAALGPTWRRRVRATPTEAMLMFGALAAMAVVVISYGGDKVNVVDQLGFTFFASEQEASADSRVSLWGSAVDQISEKPVFGGGLGLLSPVRVKGYQDDKLLTSHNIALDVTTRSGFVGAGLLLVALAMTTADALKVWRRHPDDQLAALALSMLLLLAGVVGKGMVESTFEKYRLNVALGLAVGAVFALMASLERAEASAAEPDLDAAAHGGEAPGPAPVELAGPRRP